MNFNFQTMDDAQIRQWVAQQMGGDEKARNFLANSAALWGEWDAQDGRFYAGLLEAAPTNSGFGSLRRSVEIPEAAARRLWAANICFHRQMSYAPW